MRIAPALVAIAGLLLGGAEAGAETRRVAVVVGNNAGDGAQAPLRFAEDDAGKLARTLVEVGEVRPEDLALLQGRNLAAVRQALERARQAVAAYHAQADARVLFIFYFSGHSDGEALELGADRLPFADLRQALADTGAEVRLGIVDSCRAGALLSLKGGQRGSGFQIRLTDELATTGTVLLTSSAADEVALESKELRGSYFTQNLISALRGAADLSGDGRITLAEAYQYAFVHTVSATAATEIGPQHPEFDMRLSGEGELVLAQLDHLRAGLCLPEGVERARVTDLVRDEVIAELAPGAARRLMVPPGPYSVTAWRSGRPFAGRIQVAAGQVRDVAWAELTAATELPAARKGGEVAAPSSEVTSAPAAAPNPAPTAVLAVGLGINSGVANGLGAMPSLSLDLRGTEASGRSVAVQLSTGRGAGFRETDGLALIGYRYGVELGPAQVWIAPEVGAGVVFQSPDTSGLLTSPALEASLALGAQLHLAGPVALVAQARIPICLLKRDGNATVVVLPAGWLGLSVAL